MSTGAYRITITKGKVILIYPYLNENPASPIMVKDLERLDLVCITHLTFDHLGDTVREGILVGALPSPRRTGHVWFAV